MKRREFIKTSVASSAFIVTGGAFTFDKKKNSDNSLIILIFSFILCIGFPLQVMPQKSETKYEGYNIPIRPGIPGESPFWNTYSKRFMYAPAFDFNLIEKSTFYRFTAIPLTTNEEFTFDADEPWAPLSPIWAELPVGHIALIVEGHDDRNQILGLSGTRVFYRAAEYNGPYVGQKLDYRESAERALKFLFNLQPIQTWLEARLDTTYFLYCYPSKIIGAVVESMVLYSKIATGADKEKALLIARNAADFLISISETEGSPFEYFPPTYYTKYESINRWTSTRAKEFQGQLMMTYPADVANIYLNLSDATGNKKYFKEAVKIANTYLKTQLPSGTWQLKVWMETGEPVNSNVCMPTSQISLFDRFEQQYQILDYKTARDSAFKWIMQNPVKTFYWEGQFEDIPPVKEYANLSAKGAMGVASYLLGHYRQNPKYISLAEEILRFAEDQFIVWEKPLPKEEYRTETWLNPCVLEQYRYYTPVGSSATTAMATFQKAYEATGKEVYLKKATEFANNLTNVQDSQTGQYYTLWDTNPKHKWIGWFNCATHDIKAILEFDKLIKAEK